MGTYTTVAKVASLLGETLDGTTTPSESQVEDFISWAEAEIDLVTGTSYSEQTATNELYDYDKYSVFVKEPQVQQIGRVDHIYAPIKNVFKLNNGPIISMTKLETNKGTNESPNWETLTEGTDYILYKDANTVAFLRSNALPIEDWQGIRATYTYGHSTVPSNINKLATLMVAKETLKVKQNSSSFNSMDSISIETISITKSTRESVELMRQFKNDIDSLMEKIGAVNNWIV